MNDRAKEEVVRNADSIDLFTDLNQMKKLPDGPIKDQLMKNAELAAKDPDARSKMHVGMAKTMDAMGKTPGGHTEYLPKSVTDFAVQEHCGRAEDALTKRTEALKGQFNQINTIEDQAEQKKQLKNYIKAAEATHEVAKDYDTVCGPAHQPTTTTAISSPALGKPR